MIVNLIDFETAKNLDLSQVNALLVEGSMPGVPHAEFRSKLEHKKLPRYREPRMREVQKRYREQLSAQYPGGFKLAEYVEDGTYLIGYHKAGEVWALGVLYDIAVSEGITAITSFPTKENKQPVQKPEKEEKEMKKITINSIKKEAVQALTAIGALATPLETVRANLAQMVLAKTANNEAALRINAAESLKVKWGSYCAANGFNPKVDFPEITTAESFEELEIAVTKAGRKAGGLIVDIDDGMPVEWHGYDADAVKSLMLCVEALAKEFNDAKAIKRNPEGRKVAQKGENSMAKQCAATNEIDSELLRGYLMALETAIGYFTNPVKLFRINGVFAEDTVEQIKNLVAKDANEILRELSRKAYEAGFGKYLNWELVKSYKNLVSLTPDSVKRGTRVIETAEIDLEEVKRRYDAEVALIKGRLADEKKKTAKEVEAETAKYNKTLSGLVGIFAVLALSANYSPNQDGNDEVVNFGSQVGAGAKTVQRNEPEPEPESEPEPEPEEPEHETCSFVIEIEGQKFDATQIAVAARTLAGFAAIQIQMHPDLFEGKYPKKGEGTIMFVERVAFETSENTKELKTFLGYLAALRALREAAQQSQPQQQQSQPEQKSEPVKDTEPQHKSEPKKSPEQQPEPQPQQQQSKFDPDNGLDEAGKSLMEEIRALNLAIKTKPEQVTYFERIRSEVAGDGHPAIVADTGKYIIIYTGFENRYMVGEKTKGLYYAFIANRESLEAAVNNGDAICYKIIAHVKNFAVTDIFTEENIEAFKNGCEEEKPEIIKITGDTEVKKLLLSHNTEVIMATPPEADVPAFEIEFYNESVKDVLAQTASFELWLILHFGEDKAVTVFTAWVKTLYGEQYSRLTVDNFKEEVRVMAAIKGDPTLKEMTLTASNGTINVI